MTQFNKSLVWFRRDLRSFDHAALYYALQQSHTVFCAFLFDTEVLGMLAPDDRRVRFILESVTELDTELRKLGGALIVRHGTAATEMVKVAAELDVDAVFVNRDYEPQAKARDSKVAALLNAAGRQLLAFKDQVIFESLEVVAQSGKPFSVFTPYKNAWFKKLHTAEHDISLQPYPIEHYHSRLERPQGPLFQPIPTLEALGFSCPPLSHIDISAGMSGAQQVFENFVSRMHAYDIARDFPALDGPSRLSVHLRFGTISIRGLVRRALEEMRAGAGKNGAAVWLGELIWRDFYFMILDHHPHVAERAFKPGYDAIAWHTGPLADEMFHAWCEGRTGFPIVDAGMRQLNQTGYMHNRLRMLTASFLIKDLGIDWRQGERYFAQKLMDYDLAANNGGWQWAASSGCDAQPYFRIFNPITQSQKFDAKGEFLRRYVPELAQLPAKHIHAPWLAPSHVLQTAGIELNIHYPVPIIEHDLARQHTLARYAVVKKAKIVVESDSE